MPQTKTNVKARKERKVFLTDFSLRQVLFLLKSAAFS